VDDDFKFEHSTVAVAILVSIVIGILVLVSLVPRFEAFQAEPHEPQSEARPAPPLPPPPQPNTQQPVSNEPPVVVQYIATETRGAPRLGQRHQRVDIVRGENWTREETSQDQGVSVRFRQARSNASIVWRRNADGADAALTALYERMPAQLSEAPDFVSYSTGRAAEALGERCAIWEVDYVREERRRPYTRSSWCITDDGIRLWSRGRDLEGREHVTAQLVSLQRRDVAPEEVAPPARLFQWETWRDEAEPAPAHNLRIDMVSRPGAYQPDSESIRERGAWRYRHTVDGAQRSWRITSPHLVFDYSEGRSALVVTRNLRVVRDPPTRREDDLRGPLIEPVRAEFIAWHWCRWHRMSAPSHTSAKACITRDGLILARTVAGDGGRGGLHYFSVRATNVSRAPLPISALAPPPQAFDWLN